MRALALALLAVGCAGYQYLLPRNQGGAGSATGLEYRQGVFETADGLHLFEQSWRPTEHPVRAVLIITHGLKDHSSRYAQVAAQLTRQGFAVYGFDLRGHGNSEGYRVWVDSFDQYVDDLDRFVGLVKAREPGRPLFLFGHSMGGAIVTELALTRRPAVRGLVLSGPALKVTSDVGSFLVAITRFLGVVAPHLAVLDLPNSSFSRDPQVVADMTHDPLVFQGSGPARTAAQLLSAIRHIQHSMEELTLPVLLLHGRADKLTNPEGSQEMYRRAGSTDKTLKLYEGYYHDLLHEPERARVEGDLVQWLTARAQ
ncbi:MAG TPA: lysophospholipase [Polyangia bacterium]|nr:lysophospholipase [Polyangia bacterium]